MGTNLMLYWIVAALMMLVMIMMVRTRSGDVKPKCPIPPPTPLVAALSALGRDSIVGGTLGASVIIRGGSSSSNSPRTTSFTVLHEKIVTAEVVVGALEALIP